MCLSQSSLKHLQKSGYNFNKCGAREAVLLPQPLHRYSIRQQCYNPLKHGHTVFTIRGTWWNLREPCYNSLLQSDSLRGLLKSRSAKVQTLKNQIRLSGWWDKGTYIFISSMGGFDTKLGLSPHLLCPFDLIVLSQVLKGLTDKIWKLQIKFSRFCKYLFM